MVVRSLAFYIISKNKIGGTKMKLNQRFSKLMTMMVASSMLMAGCGGDEPVPAPVPDKKPISDDMALNDTIDDITDSFAFNLGAEPETLDPALNSTVDGSQVINHTFEGLTRSIGGETVPGVAETWDISETEEIPATDTTEAIPAGLPIYTFKLREDAKWSDGQPVVAGDFVYAWQRAVNPATASDYAYIFGEANILNAKKILTGEKDPSTLGIRAVDDHTLEVILSNPTEYFLSMEH